MRSQTARHAPRAIAAVILAAVCSVTCANTVEVVDDRGVRVTLDSPARRIVSLAPSITELVFAAGAGGKLTGVPRFSDYPAPARSITQIGDATRIDLERVVSLRPDLVVAWKTGNHAADFERLEQLGFPVFVAEPGTLAALPRLVRAIAALAGTAVIGEAAAVDFERGIGDLDAQFRARSPVRVFYEIWHRPLMTVSGTHMISDVIALCGGVNIFSGVPALTPVVSLESVIAGRPDVVLGGSSATTREEFAEPWRQAARYAGLRDLNVMYVDPDYIQRQTTRILSGARIVCEHLDAVRSSHAKRSRSGCLVPSASAAILALLPVNVAASGMPVQCAGEHEQQIGEPIQVLK